MNSKVFTTSLKNEALGFALVIGVWAVVSGLYPSYIIPTPFEVISEASSYLPEDLLSQAGITLWRLLQGFGLALLLGVLITLAVHSVRAQKPAMSVMMAIQVIPGTILGVVFLLMFGLGGAAPVMMILVLVLPTVVISLIGGLEKRDRHLEQYLATLQAKPSLVLSHVLLPALVPAIQNSLSLGFSLAAKVVVLAEYIGAQDGLGYLLNRAQVTLNMKEVFFYLLLLLIFTLLFQAVQTAFFTTFFKKYSYPA